jgi:hypothetical protein
MKKGLFKIALTLVFIIFNYFLFAQVNKNIDSPKHDTTKIENYSKETYSDINNLPKVIPHKNIDCDCLCGKSKGQIISIVLINALQNLSSIISEKASNANDKYKSETNVNKSSVNEDKFEAVTRVVVNQLFGVDNNIQIKSVEDKYLTTLDDNEIEEKQEILARLIIKNPKAVVDYYSEKSNSKGKEKQQIKLVFMDSSKMDTVILDYGTKKIYNSSSIDSFNNWFIKTILDNGLIIKSDSKNFTIEICYEKRKILEQSLLNKEKSQEFDMKKFEKIFNEELKKIEEEKNK